MKKLNILATVILGIGTFVLGLYLIMKLGFQKVILPRWALLLVDFIVVIGSTVSAYCMVKQNRENNND